MKLTLKDLQDALRGGASAIRCITKLAPAGGDSSKVFPSTYEGGSYATEGAEYQFGAVDRGGKLLREIVRYRRVSLDSVQSQANRFEHALLNGYRQGKLEFPLLVVNFALA